MLRPTANQSCLYGEDTDFTAGAYISRPVYHLFLSIPLTLYISLQCEAEDEPLCGICGSDKSPHPRMTGLQCLPVNFQLLNNSAVAKYAPET